MKGTTQVSRPIILKKARVKVKGKEEKEEGTSLGELFIKVLKSIRSFLQTKWETKIVH